MAYGCIQIRKLNFLMKDLFVIRSCSQRVTIQCPATDASNNEIWSLHIWSQDLLRDRDTSIYIKTDTQLWETETAVVNDIIQTLCFVYCVLQRHCLSFTANWHTTTLTFQTCQCCLNWKWPVMNIFTVHNLHYFQVIFKWHFILYPSLKVLSVLFW